MLYTDSCSEWCWFALYCRRIYFELWTSFITQFTQGERNKTSRLRAVWGIWSVMDHPIQALTAPLLIWLCYILYIDIYKQVYSKLVSARVCRADFQVFFLMCFHSNMTTGADQSCCLRGSGGGQLLWSLLPFLRGCFTWIVASISSSRSHSQNYSMCGNSPSTRYIKSGQTNQKVSDFPGNSKFPEQMRQSSFGHRINVGNFYSRNICGLLYSPCSVWLTFRSQPMSCLLPLCLSSRCPWSLESGWALSVSSSVEQPFLVTVLNLTKQNTHTQITLLEVM